MSQERAPHGRPGLILYLGGWVAVGAVAAVALVLTLGSSHPSNATLPPLHQVRLETAARSAGCTLQRRASPRADEARSARPGVFDRPLSAVTVAAAAAHGTIVIEYDPGISAALRTQLTHVQHVIPAGTIVAPRAAGQTDALRVTGARRVLRCPVASTHAVEALRLFRGRYTGTFG